MESPDNLVPSSRNRTGIEVDVRGAYPLAMAAGESRGVAGESVVVTQGHRIGRPSQLHVRLDGSTPVLSGRAVISPTGTLRLP
jgi:predicted PhzF superfamily epimerase YddE/YHI9